MRYWRFYLTTLALAPIGTAGAQATPARPVIGVYAGLDRTSLRGPDVPGPLHTNGALGGVWARWSLGGRFAFQPELQFAQKGNRMLDVFAGNPYALRIRLNYVEVPLLVRASGNSLGGRLVPYLLAGPELAFKAGCDVKVFGLTGDYTCDDLPEAEALDYGVIAGGGVDFPFLGRTFTLSARYDHGLKDVFKGTDPKNRAWSLMVGVPLK